MSHLNGSHQQPPAFEEFADAEPPLLEKKRRKHWKNRRMILMARLEWMLYGDEPQLAATSETTRMQSRCARHRGRWGKRRMLPSVIA
jgi:hypothetical protein